VEFSDFAITALIFDHVFVESLQLRKGAAEGTRKLVEEIAAGKKRAVGARDIKSKLKISIDQAYSKLRYAEKTGVIQRANKAEKSNLKLYLPVPRPRFVPDPQKLFRKLKNLNETVRFVHPLTGKCVIYKREK
jgi:hypothetical protein